MHFLFLKIATHFLFRKNATHKTHTTQRRKTTMEALNTATTKKLTTALEALAKTREEPNKLLGKLLEKLGENFLTTPNLVRFFRTAERAKKAEDYSACKTALQTYCQDETVQTALDEHHEGVNTTGTLSEKSWAALAYAVFDALFPNGKTTTSMATAMEQLPKREQGESLETFHARYMKLMKDTEWARILFGLDIEAEWPLNMTKIWKKKVTCDWAQIPLATTQTPYEAYITLQAILEGTSHTLDENKPQVKKDTFMMMEDNKTNDILLALKENDRRMERLEKRLQDDGYKRKREEREDEDKRQNTERPRKHCEKCPPEKNQTHNTADCTADVTCNACGRKGHYGSDCRQKNKVGGNGSSPKQACFDFKRGKCTRDNCRYSHSNEQRNNGDRGYNGDRGSRNCYQFNRTGRCDKFACPYEHKKPRY